MVRLLFGIGENFDFVVVRGRKKIAMESISALILAGGRGKGHFLTTVVRGSCRLNNNAPKVIAGGGCIS